ncbi:MAG: hypothetical protein OXP11_21175 [Gammaproteobacteria bacterium]|nr:hypothetical protein [Gammaproteobacteria bacterium]
MLPRYLFATASGVAVTLGLFLLMQGLIESDRSPFTEGVTGRIVDFVRVEEDIDIPQKDRKPEPPRNRQNPRPIYPSRNLTAAVTPSASTSRQETRGRPSSLDPATFPTGRPCPLSG